MQSESDGSWIGYSLASGAGGVFALSSAVNWVGMLAVVVPILPPIVREVLAHRREIVRLRDEVKRLEEKSNA